MQEKDTMLFTAHARFPAKLLHDELNERLPTLRKQFTGIFTANDDVIFSPLFSAHPPIQRYHTEANRQPNGFKRISVRIPASNRMVDMSECSVISLGAFHEAIIITLKLGNTASPMCGFCWFRFHWSEVD